jgi:hypothetical protein
VTESITKKKTQNKETKNGLGTHFAFDFKILYLLKLFYKSNFYVSKIIDMSNFTYNIPFKEGQTITKPSSFNMYLYDLWHNITKYDGANFDTTTRIADVHFFSELTTEQQDLLTQQVQAYVDPPYYKIFRQALDMPLTTENINSTEFVTVNTSINSATVVADQGTVVKLGGLKTVVKYTTDDVTQFANFDENSTNTVTVQFFDYTRQTVLVTNEININDILTAWKNDAINGGSGSRQQLKSSQFYGLIASCPIHDCIWQIRVKVTNPLVAVSLNGLQKLYYDIYYE